MGGRREGTRGEEEGRVRVNGGMQAELSMTAHVGPIKVQFNIFELGKQVQDFRELFHQNKLH